MSRVSPLASLASLAASKVYPRPPIELLPPELELVRELQSTQTHRYKIGFTYQDIPLAYKLWYDEYISKSNTTIEQVDIGNIFDLLYDAINQDLLKPLLEYIIDTRPEILLTRIINGNYTVIGSETRGLPIIDSTLAQIAGEHNDHVVVLKLIGAIAVRFTAGNNILHYHPDVVRFMVADMDGILRGLAASNNGPLFDWCIIQTSRKVVIENIVTGSIDFIESRLSPINYEALLLKAVFYCNGDVVSYCLDQIPDVSPELITLTATDTMVGRSFRCSIHGRINILKLLSGYGDINTMLIAAIIHGRLEYVRLFIELGADDIEGAIHEAQVLEMDTRDTQYPEDRSEIIAYLEQELER